MKNLLHFVAKGGLAPPMHSHFALQTDLHRSHTHYALAVFPLRRSTTRWLAIVRRPP